MYLYSRTVFVAQLCGAPARAVFENVTLLIDCLYLLCYAVYYLSESRFLIGLRKFVTRLAYIWAA